MTPTATTEHGCIIENHLTDTGTDHLVRSILAGLESPPRHLASALLYDAVGSKLFERITTLPEYYPTRTEKAILHELSGALARDIIGADIVELGSGDCSKVSILLKAVPAELLGTVRYIPLDVSRSAIEESAAMLVERFGGLRVHGVVADFLTRLDALPSGDRRVFLFLGSTLGNLSLQEIPLFLQHLSHLMRPGDLFLLGVDMVKSAAVLEAAYNDGAHVTEAFNRNILNVVNSLTGSDFVPEAFEHVAFYNERESRIEMHLRATRDTMVRTVRFSREFFLHKGETIHTENSHKFTEEYLDDLVSGTGLRIRHRTSDRRRWFTVLCLEKERVPA